MLYNQKFAEKIEGSSISGSHAPAWEPLFIKDFLQQDLREVETR